MSSTNAFNTQQDTTATGKEQPGYLERIYNAVGGATNSASNPTNTTASNTDSTTGYRNQQPHVGGVGDLGTKHDADVSRLPDERANPNPYTSGGTSEALENPNISDPNSIQQRLNARNPPNPYPEGNAGVGRTGDSNPLSSNNNTTTNPFRETAAGTTGFGSSNRDTLDRDNNRGFDSNNSGFDNTNRDTFNRDNNSGFGSTTHHRDNNKSSNTADTVAAGAAAAGATAAGFNAERDHRNRDQFDRDNNTTSNTGFGSTNRDNFGRDNTTSNSGFDSTNRDNNSGFDSTTQHRDHHKARDAAGAAAVGAGLNAERKHHDRDRDDNTTSNTGFGSTNRDNFDRDNTTRNTGFDSTNRDTFNRDNNSGLDSTTQHRDHHKARDTAGVAAAGAGLEAERKHHDRDRDNNTTSNTGFGSSNRDNFGRDNTTSNTGFDSTNRDNNSGFDSTTQHRDHHKARDTAGVAAAGAGLEAERKHHDRDRDDKSTGSHQWRPEQKSWDTGNVAGTMHDPTQHGHSGGVTGSNADADHGLGGPHHYDRERGNRDESALGGNNVAGATDIQPGREGAYGADSRDRLGDSGRQGVDTSDHGRHTLDAAYRDPNREGNYNEGDDTTATSSTAKPGGPGKLDKLHGKLMVAKGKLTKDDEAIAQGQRLQTEGVTVHPNDFLNERRE